jgi:hypothetical protein
MNITIQFITPDGSLAVPRNTIVINDIVLVQATSEDIENLIRGIAHGYGIPHGWEVEKIRSICAQGDMAYAPEVRADVYFRKMVFGEITIRLAGLLRQVAYALHDSTVQHDAQTIEKHKRLFTEAVDALNKLNL